MVDLADIDDWLARREAQVPNLRPDCAKSVVWANGQGVRTKTAVLYIHGFSATLHELRPLPDIIASHLDANLHYTRLTGHGQDGAAMGEATFAAWKEDVAEAILVAQTIGENVLIIGCSTGCTLAADALANGAQVAGLVCISPNFGLTHKIGQMLLDMPLVQRWGHIVAGKSRSFDVLSDAHGAYWTTSYPTQSVYPMADAVRSIRRTDLSCIATPAFFAVNPCDQVVSPQATARVMARWGAPTHHHTLVQTPADDKMGHIMAGDVFSPAQTASLAAAVLRWFSANVAT